MSATVPQSAIIPLRERPASSNEAARLLYEACVQVSTAEAALAWAQKRYPDEPHEQIEEFLRLAIEAREEAQRAYDSFYVLKKR